MDWNEALEKVRATRIVGSFALCKSGVTVYVRGDDERATWIHVQYPDAEILLEIHTLALAERTQ